MAAVDVQSDDVLTGDFPGELTVEFSNLKGHSARVLNKRANVECPVLPNEK